MAPVQLRVMILVKAAPVLTSRLEESMCVAAIDLDEPRWIRLHPIPFRDLDTESRFKKYQELRVSAIRPRSDRRPESWVPLEGSITLGPETGPDSDWTMRRNRLERLPRPTMCDLHRLNLAGSGLGIPSLAIVRTRDRPLLDISKRNDDQIDKWTKRAEAIANRPSLFDDTTSSKPVFEVVPWRFRYRYHCLDPDCGGHAQTIIDWEIVTLWRRVRHRSNWRELMRAKFEDQLWADGRATELYVGNQEQHPQSFLVLGIFWPPSTPLQGSLLP